MPVEQFAASLPASLSSHRSQMEETYNLHRQQQQQMIESFAAGMSARDRAEIDAFLEIQRLEHEQLMLQQEMEIRHAAEAEGFNVQAFNHPSHLGLPAAMAHRSLHEEAMNPGMQTAQGEFRDSWEDGPTTVLVRELPRRYTQQQFRDMMQCGFDGLFDFLHLPRDVQAGMNMGYGFVNFLRPEYALLFRKDFDGLEVAGKKLRVHPAQLQGFEANYQRFAASNLGQDPPFSPILGPQVAW